MHYWYYFYISQFYFFVHPLYYIMFACFLFFLDVAHTNANGTPDGDAHALRMACPVPQHVLDHIYIYIYIFVFYILYTYIYIHIYIFYCI